jgi:hypothetical protein
MEAHHWNVVVLSTGWFNNGGRCLNYNTIHGNGKSVKAKVPPCPNNIVDASNAVWEALGMLESKWGGLDIYWHDD